LYLLYKNDIINNKTPNEINAIVLAIVLKSIISYKNNLSSVIIKIDIAITRICFFFWMIPTPIRVSEKIPQRILNQSL
jgi:hypothetical protein